MKQAFEKHLEKIVPWILEHGLQILLITIGAYILIRISRAFINKAVRLAVAHDSTSSKESEKKREDTLIQIFTTTTRIIIIIMATLMVLQQIGVEIGPILAGAGIVGLAIGFGGQYLIRDIISGLFIILENQYRIGDVVRFNNTAGLVEDITLRKTTFRDIDGTVHHLPHGEIKMVSNLSKNFARVNLDIQVAYNSNLEHVIEVINKVGQELSEDPGWKDSIIQVPQFVRVEELAESAIILKILGDTLPHMQGEVSGEMRKRIIIAFNREGIEIPFPQRVIHQTKN
jgi:moderate conductance mechanosensitive channel